MKKKFVFLPLFLSVLVLIGCQDASEDVNVPETTAPLEQSVPAMEPIILAAGGKSEYTIVRAETADPCVVDAGSDLLGAFLKAGIDINLTDDWERPGTDPATRPQKEILLGVTNRGESIQAASKLRVEEYSIAVENERIVICGGSPEATAEACATFVRTFLSSIANGEILLPRDTVISHHVEYPIDTLSLDGNPITEYSIAYTESQFKDAAVLLQQEIALACGWRLDVVSMNGARDKKILVGLPGNTDISPCEGTGVSAITQEGTDPAMYAIEHKEGTLVLAGKSGWTTSNAVLLFSESYLKGKNGKVDIGDIALTDTTMHQYPVYAEADFRIMTLNTLGAQENYEERFPYMIDLIKQYLPDVIGLQEANKTVQSYVIKPLLEFYAYNQRWHDNGEIANYTPILYRKDKFELLEAGVRFLRSSYKGTNTKSISWAVLSPLDGSPDFIVTNLHGAMLSASYNIPGTNEVEGAEWRADNIREMLEIIAELRTKYGNLPSFSTGDYNFYRHAKGYAEAVKGGLLNPEIVSTVSSMEGIGTNHEVGKMPVSKESIDRIFISEGIISYVHRIITDENALKASDHCAVYIDVKIPH